MADAIALPLALLALTATLAIALVRPSHVSEAAAALAGAVVLLAVRAISLSRAEASLRSLGPTVGFLAALLLIAEGCRREGLFEAIGHLMARRSGHDPCRLLAFVFIVASAVTIVLGLDATVVLLPPIVLATTARLSTDPKRRSTPAPTWPTQRRCCCRSPTSPTSWPSVPAACPSRTSPS